MLKVALAEGFVHHGAVDDLRAQQRIDVPGILAQVREALGVRAEGSTPPEGDRRVARRSMPNPVGAVTVEPPRTA